jgi:hypothetical protein
MQLNVEKKMLIMCNKDQGNICHNPQINDHYKNQWVGNKPSWSYFKIYSLSSNSKNPTLKAFSLAHLLSLPSLLARKLKGQTIGWLWQVSCYYSIQQILGDSLVKNNRKGNYKTSKKG